VVLDPGEERTGGEVVPRFELRILLRGRHCEGESDKGDDPLDDRVFAYAWLTAHADVGLVVGRTGLRDQFGIEIAAR
jgi:hypothetical protein